MRVLLTNDDGIQSDGLLSAYQALRSAGHQVTVCAPDRERSAQSQAITLRAPLEVKPRTLPDGAIGYAITGTPADCSRLGFTMLVPEPVDLVISGINNDFNLGYDVNYSGTVAAALEAAGAGYLSIAASLERSSNYDWLGAGAILMDVVENLPQWSIPIGITLNLNIPSQLVDQKPIWAPTQNLPNPDYYHKEISPNGNALYTRWRGDQEAELANQDPHCDVALTKAGYVTITPLLAVSPHPEVLSRLEAWNGKRP